jgi:uncharacterized protein
MATTETVPGARFATLDIIRGIAVMGILVANMPGFGLPGAAYFSPMAWGGTGPAEIAAWATTFVLIEGKMRGLFTFLFGASMLLVIERAEASGRSPAQAHYARTAVLLAIGLAHLYLIWWGDILAHYAMVGAIAFLFRKLSARDLLIWGLLALTVTLLSSGMGWMALLDSAARDTPQAVETWNNFARSFGVPPREWMDTEIAAYRGAWEANVAWRYQHEDPLGFLMAVGPETLSAMLLGMAAFRSGFLTGAWTPARYRDWAIVCLSLAWGAYALLAAVTYIQGFDQRCVFFGSIVASVPFRILGVVGYAALFIWLVRPESWLGQRLAAVGRAAFTNYLGTSILVTAIFYGWGFGQFAEWSRAQLYIVPPLVWVIMLAWSKPWLDRYRYGPLEWLWRSISRWQLQPMRKATPLPLAGGAGGGSVEGPARENRPSP